MATCKRMVVLGGRWVFLLKLFQITEYAFERSAASPSRTLRVDFMASTGSALPMGSTPVEANPTNKSARAFAAAPCFPFRCVTAMLINVDGATNFQEFTIRSDARFAFLRPGMSVFSPALSVCRGPRCVFGACPGLQRRGVGIGCGGRFCAKRIRL